MLAHLQDPQQAVAWLRQRVGAPGAGTLRSDSRQVRPGDAFVASPGGVTDGREHVTAALEAGAAACLVEADGVQAFAWPDSADRIATYTGLKAACGPIAAHWFGHPGRRLDVVAVTATNGKSSTAWWTAQALTALGRRCAVVGTLGIGEPPPAFGADDAPAALDSTGLTTPDPITLQAALARLADGGCSAVAVEASSIGLAEHRLDGLPVRVAQFINFTQDHLDYHRDMAAYWAAKRQLFDWPGLQAAVVDLDDAHGARLAAELATRQATGVPLALWTCSRRDERARLLARREQHAASGLGFEVVERGADGQLATAAVRSRLIGDHNVHNLLSVLGALRALGVPLERATAVMEGLGPVPGRLQRVPPPSARAEGLAELPAVVVDYAHTPDALDKALAALQPLTIARGGQLWCVFGCGGNRDVGKRPLMAAVAQQRADRLVLTTDNPRFESPELILSQMLAGLTDPGSAQVVPDRAQAIAQVVAAAGPHDVVLLAGKGHEDYQEVRGERLAFSDLAQASQALQRRVVA